MPSAPAFTKTGTKASAKATLDAKVFGEKVENHELLKYTYEAYLANGRSSSAVVKRRGEVRGGGRKPWRQKGTGRARVGSIRSPIWRGGGITFGPTGEENHSKVVPKAAKRKALRQALSIQAADGKVLVVEAFESREGKVKPTLALFKKIGAKGQTLVVVETKDELVERATRNLPEVKAVQAKYLNTYDILNADTVVIEKKALAIVNEWLSPAKETKQ